MSKDFSRLARSTKDLLELVERFKEKNIHLVSLKENLDTSTATGKLMLTMIAAINELSVRTFWKDSVRVSLLQSREEHTKVVRLYR